MVNLLNAVIGEQLTKTEWEVGNRGLSRLILKFGNGKQLEFDTNIFDDIVIREASDE